MNAINNLCEKIVFACFKMQVQVQEKCGVQNDCKYCENGSEIEKNKT